MKIIDINNLVKESLKPLGVPVEFQFYNGKKNLYITFFCYNEQGEVFSDDKETVTGSYIQIDIWYKENSDLGQRALNLLRDVGFTKRTIYDAPYEPDTRLFHKVLRLLYVEN